MAKYSGGTAVGGALTGAAAGSSFGPIGTGLGALAGGVAGLFGSKKKRTKKPRRVNTFDPQQQELYNQYVGSLRGEGPFKDMYNFDAEGYNNVFDQTTSRPAYRNFQENIVPQITGQFRQGNLMNSSYAGESLARAGRNVQENLDAERSRNIFAGQQQSQANKQNAINNILGQKTFDYQQRSNSPGIDQILNTTAPAVGEWFANYLRNSSNTAKPTTPVAA